MAKTTNTLNPLHFEDLEPHRFEDLVRQLAYDFRTWRSLEATGRSGSDEGMDIRGLGSWARWTLSSGMKTRRKVPKRKRSKGSGDRKPYDELASLTDSLAARCH